MAETAGVRGDELHNQFMQSVGCNFDPGLRGLIPEALAEQLGGYFDAQDVWQASCNEAASTEADYTRIMGKSSRKKIERQSMFQDWNGGYTGYGETKAGQQAKQLENGVRTAAEDVSKRATDITNNEVEQVIWRSLGGLEHSHWGPAQLDLLGFAATATELLATVQENTDQPLTIIRKRWGDSWSRSSEPTNFSDIIHADQFSIEVTNDQLILMALNAQVVKFEELRHVSYGGQPGLIGSASFEYVWVNAASRHSQREKFQSLSVQQHERLAVLNLLGHKQIGDDLDGSLPVLRNLAGSTLEAFWEQLKSTDYFMHGLSGIGEVPDKTDEKTAAVVGPTFADVVESIPEVNRNNAGWMYNLQTAIEAFKSQRKESERQQLMEQLADTLETSDQFYDI